MQPISSMILAECKCENYYWYKTHFDIFRSFFAGLTYMQLLLLTWPIVKYQLYFQPEKLAESFLYFCQGMGVGKKHFLFLALMLFKFLKKKKEPSW